MNETAAHPHEDLCHAQPAAATACHGPDTSTRSASTFAAVAAPPTPALAAVIDVIDQPFHQLEACTWLHDRSEHDVLYKLLTDAYRFRVEDGYMMTGDVSNASLDGAAADSGRRHFRRCLSLAERRPALVIGLSIYGNSLMPMQSRMFAEQVYGQGPGGQSWDAMRQVMMKREADGGKKMHPSVLDLSSNLPRV
ncbi:MAG: hypothetical protein M1826_004154 [Phylliscum demangeonii]|nr:MAG: hypothetical protein M1826_004154 [Phylliscum demangeonii]